MSTIGRTTSTKFWALIAITVLCCRVALAQIKSGTIVGTVTNPSGAVVPAANIVVDVLRGVFVRGRVRAQTVRPGASNVTIDGYGVARRHDV